IEVVVPDEQLSLAIGRRGQNVRLASQLTGWDIDIMTEAEESERRQKEFAARTARFVAALDVDETLAQLLASEGFDKVEEVAMVDPSEISSIEGLDEATAAELQERAKAFIEREATELEDKRKALGVTDQLKAFVGLTPSMLVALGENKIKTLEDFADCATDDLIGWNERKNGETIKHPGALTGQDVSVAEAQDMIMKARVQLGWIEAPVAEPETVEAPTA
ncbi:MAG: helix-hairpin-helix domain-containing protein, partial [Pseudomonadota bacterium]|nr:helix-hairpin-helix domain-containing protein [Pseudomonadota bacterium]